MTTLQAIGLTLLSGTVITTLSHLLFGYALQRRTPMIAPRCHGRPPDTIYSPSATAGNVHYRGSRFVGYIWWTLGLSYDAMLRGVPGTGTRKNGTEGRLLDVKLDGIVVLRFHALCLRVAILTTFLCIVFILPMNVTAHCYVHNLKDIFLSTTKCPSPDPEDNTTLTNYERTTIANIPPILYPDDNHDMLDSHHGNSSLATRTSNSDTSSSSSSSMFTSAMIDITYQLRILDPLGWYSARYAASLVRLYFIAFSSWVVYAYACWQLKLEWKKLLALRRVYYLESDVWRRRQKELKETVQVGGSDLYHASGDDDDEEEEEDASRHADANASANANANHGGEGNRDFHHVVEVHGDEEKEEEEEDLEIGTVSSMGTATARGVHSPMVEEVVPRRHQKRRSSASRRPSSPSFHSLANPACAEEEEEERVEHEVGQNGVDKQKHAQTYYRGGEEKEEEEDDGESVEVSLSSFRRQQAKQHKHPQQRHASPEQSKPKVQLGTLQHPLQQPLEASSPSSPQPPQAPPTPRLQRQQSPLSLMMQEVENEKFYSTFSMGDDTTTLHPLSHGNDDDFEDCPSHSSPRWRRRRRQASLPSLTLSPPSPLVRLKRLRRSSSLGRLGGRMSSARRRGEEDQGLLVRVRDPLALEHKHLGLPLYAGEGQEEEEEKKQEEELKKRILHQKEEEELARQVKSPENQTQLRPHPLDRPHLPQDSPREQPLQQPQQQQQQQQPTMQSQRHRPPPRLRKKKKQWNDRPRDPWILNPDLRETPPNIELYSVLVGGLPIMPAEVNACTKSLAFATATNHATTTIPESFTHQEVANRNKSPTTMTKHHHHHHTALSSQWQNHSLPPPPPPSASGSPSVSSISSLSPLHHDATTNNERSHVDENGTRGFRNSTSTTSYSTAAQLTASWDMESNCHDCDMEAGVGAKPNQDRLGNRQGSAIDNEEADLERRVNWQLELVKAFFHQCIPPPPGYSSSLAAVTVVPDGRSMAMAWRKWLLLVKALRMLRYCRMKIDELEELQQQYEQQHEPNERKQPQNQVQACHSRAQEHVSEHENFVSNGGEARSVSGPSILRPYTKDVQQQEAQEPNNDGNDDDHLDPPHDFDYDAVWKLALLEERERNARKRRGSYEHDGGYIQVNNRGDGSEDGTDDPLNLTEASRDYMYANFPEQVAVYGREYAFDSAYCFPYCCLEYGMPLCGSSVRGSRRGRSICDQLDMWRDLEEEAVDRVRNAQEALRSVQRSAVKRVATIERPKREIRRRKSSVQQVCGVGNLHDQEHGLYRCSQNMQSGVRGRGSLVSSPQSRHPSLPPTPPKCLWTERNRGSRGDHSIACLDFEGRFMKRRQCSRKKQQPSLIQKQLPRPTQIQEHSSLSRQPQSQSQPQQSQNRRRVSFDDSVEVSGSWRPDGDAASDTQSAFSHRRLRWSDASASVTSADIEAAASRLHRRSTTGRTRTTTSSSGRDCEFRTETSDEWRKAVRLRRQNSTFMVQHGGSFYEKLEIENGVWGGTSVQSFGRRVWAHVQSVRVQIQHQLAFLLRRARFIKKKSHEKNNEDQFLSDHEEESEEHEMDEMDPQTSPLSFLPESYSSSSFAVVTFTSRQAAVAARQCLVDGRGAGRWAVADRMPIHPLSDTMACDLCLFRGHFCRPVTMTKSYTERVTRNVMSKCCLFVIYVFYIVPITFISTLVKTENIQQVLPNVKIATLLTGIVPGMLQTLFFAACPVIFKGIANSGSNASSFASAETAALKYFWWFMVVAAFSGSTIAAMAWDIISSGKLELDVSGVLLSIAATIPKHISAVWINWIIVRALITLQLIYLLQSLTFLLGFFGCSCCHRLTMGGGPGRHPPYRIYIDSGVVFMCVVALGFASPLVAPCGLLYFLVSIPLFRRNFIYVYRLRFDCGGSRWPFLFDVCMSSILVGEVLLSTMMVLKKAIGPALVAFLPILPTLIFWKSCRNRFLGPYMDAGLLQASLLDWWDEDASAAKSYEEREEFRRFLVDAHKAAYIPVCIAGTTTKKLSAEPAVVVPLVRDNATCAGGEFSRVLPS